MRPVATWKSTDAAPTPIRDGAIAAPSAFNPWQEEHPFRKSCLPSSINAVRSAAVIGVPVVAPATEKVVPMENKARTKRSGATARCLRNLERRFKIFFRFLFVGSYLIK
jgi:hypothetical protein